MSLRLVPPPPPRHAKFTLTSFIASIFYPNVPSRTGTKICLIYATTTVDELLRQNNHEFQ